MKIRDDLKKVLKINFIILLIFIIIYLLVNNYFYKRYYTEVNEYIIFVLTEVEKEYPDANIQEIYNSLNTEERNIDVSILNKYGINIYEEPLLNTFDTVYNISNIVLIILVLSTIVTSSTIYIYENNKKDKEIKRITKVLRNLNQGKYNIDLTKEREGALGILNDELYKTTIMLREKAENALKDKLVLKDSISNISHQIKTPLTSMSIMVDNLLESTPDKQTRQEFLKDIEGQINHINYLVIALLKLSRLEANVVEFKTDKINIKNILLDSIKKVNALSELKGVNIHLTGNNTDFFQGDYNWSLEAFTNILKNSIEHTKKDKNIYLSYNDNPFYTKIIIKDEGVGIEKEEVKHIFERFYKGSNQDPNSIGIGLALSKEIIEKQNGTIKVDSKVNVGTTFTIKFFK